MIGAAMADRTDPSVVATSMITTVSSAVEKDAILQKLRERIVAFATSRVRRDVAEDLAQNVLLLLTTKYADKSEATDLVPLAFRIVGFMLTAHFRKEHR